MSVQKINVSKETNQGQKNTQFSFSKKENNEEKVENSKNESFLYDIVTNLENLRDPFQNILKKKDSEEKLVSNSKEQLTDSKSDIEDEKEIDKEVTYQDLYEMVNDQIATGNVDSEIIEPKVEYPPYMLKGIVIRGELQKAILTFEDKTYIISTGDQIGDWVIEEIKKDQVLLKNKEGQCFILTLEGVVFDEE